MTNHINPGLSKLTTPLAGLKLDERNARLHEARSIESIKTSLTEFGQQKPIVILADGTIIAGNGTYTAALALGWSKLAAVRFTDEKKARAYAVADNRTAELSEWDPAVLAATLAEMAEAGAGQVSTVGFTDAEAAKILAAAAELPPGAREEVSEEPPPAGAASHVRMVQLFLDSTTHPRFMDAVKMLAAGYGTTNVTDTVLAAVLEVGLIYQGPTAPDAGQAPPS